MAEDSMQEARSTEAKANARVRRLRDLWTKAVNDAKGENLRVGAEKKAKLAEVSAKAAKLGYPKRSWSRMMAIWDHDDAKKKLVEETMASEDEAFVAGIARIVDDSVDVLPLFAAADLADLRALVKKADAGQDESERAARARASEAEDDDNVTRFPGAA